MARLLNSAAVVCGRHLGNRGNWWTYWVTLCCIWYLHGWESQGYWYEPDPTPQLTVYIQSKCWWRASYWVVMLLCVYKAHQIVCGCHLIGRALIHFSVIYFPKCFTQAHCVVMLLRLLWHHKQQIMMQQNCKRVCTDATAFQEGIKEFHVTLSELFNRTAALISSSL